MKETVERIDSVFAKTFKSPVTNFFLFWAANILVYVSVFGGLMDVLPPRLAWISNIVFPLCVAGGFITSLIAVRKSKGKLPSLEAVVNAGTTTLMGLFALVTIYTASFAISPTQYVTIEQFEAAGLTPNQVAQIQTYLNNQGYVTTQDLENINLTNEQKVAVSNILSELGYVTQEDVVAIAQTQISLVATQTAIAKLTTCYITPEVGVGQVAIRNSPSDKSEFVGAFGEGQRLYVVGHNGGRVNQDRWWLVEITRDDIHKTYGWVASWVVTELNEVDCMRIEVTPGY